MLQPVEELNYPWLWLSRFAKKKPRVDPGLSAIKEVSRNPSAGAIPSRGTGSPTDGFGRGDAETGLPAHLDVVDDDVPRPARQVLIDDTADPIVLEGLVGGLWLIQSQSQRWPPSPALLEEDPNGLRNVILVLEKRRELLMCLGCDLDHHSLLRPWPCSSGPHDCSYFIVSRNASQGRGLKMATRNYVLSSGKIVAHGTGEGLLQDEIVRKSYLGL